MSKVHWATGGWESRSLCHQPPDVKDPAFWSAKGPSIYLINRREREIERPTDGGDRVW